MQLHLIDTLEEVVAAWRIAFEGFESVHIRQGNILDYAEDTIVSPANSYGYMDGGIDRIYIDYFGVQIERTVQDTIRSRGESYLPVGSSVVVKTNDARIPLMIVAPTMFLPEPIRPEKCFYAMSAILNAYQRNSAHIKSVYCPGLGTGVGQVEPEDSAREMANAYRKWLSSKNT